MQKAFQIALNPDIVKRSLMVSIVVGTVLNIINQGDVLLGKQSLQIGKCILTYIVPYLVATYGSVVALMKLEIRE